MEPFVRRHPRAGLDPLEVDERSGFLRAVSQDPVLGRVKLIAEPWDLGDGGYRVGGFPAGWSEWNDQYRDIVRGFWRSDPGQLPGLARVMTGSLTTSETRRGASGRPLMLDCASFQFAV